MAGVDQSALQLQLQRWADAHYHQGVTVTDLMAMPGHAGLSFGFKVSDSDGTIDRLVMRMPPKGVRRSGNTDVLRQVPLLKALAAHGVPVAPGNGFLRRERRRVHHPQYIRSGRLRYARCIGRCGDTRVERLVRPRRGDARPGRARD